MWTYLVIFAVVFLVGYFFDLPIRIGRKFAFPLDFPVSEVSLDDERIPEKARGFLLEVRRELETLGFTPAACLLPSAPLPNMFVYSTVHVNHATRAAATAVAIWMRP